MALPTTRNPSVCRSTLLGVTAPLPSLGKRAHLFEHTNASPVMVIHCFMLPHVMALVRSELSVRITNKSFRTVVARRLTFSNDGVSEIPRVIPRRAPPELLCHGHLAQSPSSEASAPGKGHEAQKARPVKTCDCLTMTNQKGMGFCKCEQLWKVLKWNIFICGPFLRDSVSGDEMMDQT